MNETISNRVKFTQGLRDALRSKLGGKCCRCEQTNHLQFDCKVSQGGAHHEMSWRQRLNFYCEQERRGNLQLLCPKCHVEKTLDEIAARRFHEARVVCPDCGKGIRVGDQLRVREPLPVDARGDEAQKVSAASPDA